MRIALEVIISTSYRSITTLVSSRIMSRSLTAISSSSIFTSILTISPLRELSGDGFFITLGRTGSHLGLGVHIENLYVPSLLLHSSMSVAQCHLNVLADHIGNTFPGQRFNPRWARPLHISSFECGTTGNKDHSLSLIRRGSRFPLPYRNQQQLFYRQFLRWRTYAIQ